MNESINDLHVLPISDALLGKRVDVVISGSIAAVESVRFIRALRRLGADVTPWLSKGGSQFITPMAVAWAAGREPVLGFSGSESHIASGDAVVVAPASANMLANIVRGNTDSHCTALIASALGQKKPVAILPAMHDSLKEAPAIKMHLETVRLWKNLHLLQPRTEEGKQKFPEPETLADQVAHHINSPHRPKHPVLITMGTTRGYIDDVRYISNYSSGKLGSIITEELYRQGYTTEVIAGPSEHKPRLPNALHNVLTTTEMLTECERIASKGLTAGVFCASVLDYEPSEKTMGKLRSGHDSLTITFKPTAKIIEKIYVSHGPKIGFKLEVGLSEKKASEIATDYMSRYSLEALIVNELTAVSSSEHKALGFLKKSAEERPSTLNSKVDIAHFITKIIDNASTTGHSKS
jgi:phosphopantothenoylcysteine decarboxylase / phosphopantothenate---cysteine ligase